MWGNAVYYYKWVPQHIFNEVSTQDNHLEPEFLEITLVYNTRGGIDTTTSINSKSQTPVDV